MLPLPYIPSQHDVTPRDFIIADAYFSYDSPLARPKGHTTPSLGRIYTSDDKNAYIDTAFQRTRRLLPPSSVTHVAISRALIFRRFQAR